MGGGIVVACMGGGMVVAYMGGGMVVACMGGGMVVAYMGGGMVVAYTVQLFSIFWQMLPLKNILYPHFRTTVIEGVIVYGSVYVLGMQTGGV